WSKQLERHHDSPSSLTEPREGCLEFATTTTKENEWNRHGAGESSDRECQSSGGICGQQHIEQALAFRPVAVPGFHIDMPCPTDTDQFTSPRSRQASGSRVCDVRI